MTAQSMTSVGTDLEETTYREIAWRLVPYLFLLYVIAFLERVGARLWIARILIAWGPRWLSRTLFGGLREGPHWRWPHHVRWLYYAGGVYPHHAKRAEWIP